MTSAGASCITCGDVAVPMRVVAVDAEQDLAECAVDGGCASQVQIDLVGPVAVGDELLVHAGVALVRLSTEVQTA
jgi:hydrogenase assembly chaperone HypC/HupF